MCVLVYKSACAFFHGAKLLKKKQTYVYFLPKNVYFLTLVHFWTFFAPFSGLQRVIFGCFIRLSRFPTDGNHYFFCSKTCVYQKKVVILQAK